MRPQAVIPGGLTRLRQVAMSKTNKEQSRMKYLARHARYNNSAKGRARNARYEEKHPERANRRPTLDRLRKGIL